ncbi:hypothetical protein EWM64_g7848 [Hericium alpestre]|uniref:DUF6534 domain-containing protein n=1 Tax=Hericium alpestre TaxID=135208 RepID=A0A4Y9ZPH3_9AGAM|nr:hypothetical protein EWM64_g7848 [Hericium alpestre]
MADAAAAIPSLDSTMGAMFIGVVIGAMLYGIWWVDIIVYVPAFDFISLCIIAHLASQVEVLFNSFTAFLVQSFFTVRIYKLSNKNILVTGTVYALVLGQFFVTLVYFIKGIQMSTFAQLGTLKAISMAVNAMTAASDVAIALALCSMLHKSRTGFRSSDSMINKLIMFTVNTGLLTSIDAVCSLASIAGSPNTFIYICFFFTLGRLYSNSLLATLNARRSLRQSSSGNAINSETISGQGIPMQRTNVFEPNKTSGNISIKIDTTQELNSDYDSTMDAKRNEHAL